MRPDRSNYDLWVADWIEGNLDKVRSEIFMAFLEENPDLKADAEMLFLTKLSPEKYSFERKNRLRRTPEEITPAQIEYLAAACLENDLSDEQMEDLQQNIMHNNESKTVYATILRTKLVPPSVTYINKNSLRKLTVGQKVFRIAAAGLSAAAVITVLILSYVLAPESPYGRKTGIAAEQPETSVPDHYAAGDNSKIETAEDFTSQPVQAERYIKSAPSPPTAQPVPEIYPGKFVAMAVPLPGINILPAAGIETGMQKITLAASNVSFARPDEYYDDRGRIRRFIARTFREKIIKDETYSDDRIKPYELARAGVDGLNKLLDWEMKINETYDESGEVKSVYFSSALITFNAPVKKNVLGE